MTDTLAVAPAEQQLRMTVAFATDVGGRPGNEDAVLVTPLPALGSGDAGLDPGYLLAVADGMGGYQRGEVASTMAIEAVTEMFGEDPGGDTALLLKQAFRRANDKIYQNGQGASPAEMMGTTLVVAVNRGKYATIASIGDSRAYLMRAGRMTQITKDHSLVADQVAQGSLTEQEARESPHRNILTHALGHRPKLDPKMPNIFEITLLPEDRMLLCTDGFFDVLSNDEMLRIVEESSAADPARALVDVAVQRGTSDNVSAVVATVMPVREAMTLEPLGASGGVPLYALGLAAIVILALIVLILALT